MSNALQSPLTLPCGLTLKNRLVKSAMTERISGKHYEPTPELLNLYDKWSKSGAGLLVTGNVMVDPNHMESSGNVHFTDDRHLSELKKWASTAKKNDTHLFAQISHSGRQTYRFVNKHPKAPSKVQLKKIGLFGEPKAMTEDDIQSVIAGFLKAASLAKTAGFSGVQIHSAHGYLLSQFLSPRTNKRTDKWGGSIENRMRLLQTIVQQIKPMTGPDFALAVKLNSSDFQRGGFSEEDAMTVVKMLNAEKIDLLEISGGTYEQLEFLLQNDSNLKESTKKREAYFIDFAKKIRSFCTVPLLVTGGFRSFSFCNEVLENKELELIGMARPFLTNLDEIPKFLEGVIPQFENLILRTGIKQIDDAAEGGFYARQIIRIAKNKRYKAKLNPLISSIFLVIYEWRLAMMKR